MSKRPPKRLQALLPVPANDNAKRSNRRFAVVEGIPADLPIQRIEVEVLAQLLESLDPANDNEAQE